MSLTHATKIAQKVYGQEARVHSPVWARIFLFYTSLTPEKWQPVALSKETSWLQSEAGQLSLVPKGRIKDLYRLID
jgi:hypothetical protein